MVFHGAAPALGLRQQFTVVRPEIEFISAPSTPVPPFRQPVKSSKDAPRGQSVTGYQVDRR